MQKDPGTILTADQFSKALTIATNIQAPMQMLIDFLQEVTALEANNFSKALTYGGVTVNAVISPPDQQVLLNNYSTLVASLTSQVSSLPQ